MTPLNVFLIGALLLLGRAVCAEAAGKRINAQPQVYFNLTYEEHLAKAAEYAELYANRTAPSDPNHYHGIQKRGPVGGETHNDEMTNAMLEELHRICEERHAAGWHASSGYCIQPHVRRFSCGDPGAPRGVRDKVVSASCQGQGKCSVFEAMNFRGNKAKFPECAFEIHVQEEHDEGIHAEFEGHWYPESPKSPGTHDSFVTMAAGMLGYFDFGGAWSNGEGFSSRSEGAASSWSCIRCPGGLLTITSKGRRTSAYGWVRHFSA